MQRGLMIEEIQKYIEDNKYKILPESKNTSRCIDGRYEAASDLAPLAKPGADAGDLLVVAGTNNEYNLGLTHKEMLDAVLKVIGGWKHFHTHTDSHHTAPSELFYGCGHVNNTLHDPKAFALTEEDAAAILKDLEANKEELTHTELQGDHAEQAVVIIKGEDYSVFPHSSKNMVFVYHKTLDNLRRRKIAKELLPFVKIPDITEDYLYEILSQVADNQLLEIVERLASTLPVYTVIFESDGSFSIIE